jgi:hypothetical protein
VQVNPIIALDGPSCRNGPGEKARAAGDGITNAHRRSRLFSSSLTSFTVTATMPSTVRSRAPMQKALSIGVEYKELAERLPQWHLPAAHKDPQIMSRLLQGMSYCDLSHNMTLAEPRSWDFLASRTV